MLMCVDWGFRDRVNGSLGLWELTYRGMYMHELE